MNSKMAILFAGALVVGGVFVAMKSKDVGDEEEVLMDERKGGSSSLRTERRTLDSGEKALRFLQSVPGFDLNNPPSFAEIQARTGELTIAQIQELLTAHSSHEGLEGWLRSALWAELGRRNDRESFESLLEGVGGKVSGEQSFAKDQAVFSFLRGRSEKVTEIDDSVDSIFEDINVLSKRTQSQHWKSYAVTFLFEKLAGLDHEAAWDFIENPCLPESLGSDLSGLLNSNETSATIGFFQALPSAELAISYLKEWERILQLPEAVKSYETFNKQMNSRMSGFIAIPPEEAILSHALATVARFEPKVALDWLAANEVDPGKPDYNRIHGMWRQLATNYPERALEIFAQEEFIDARRGNIGWLLSDDYSLVADAISQTPKASHQTQVLQSLISSAGSGHVKDFFPTPEGPNRLPNFQQRYDYLLEAIKLGTFHEKQKESLVDNLKREFAGKLGTE